MDDGAIEFKDVSMLYRPGQPNELHGMSLQINLGTRLVWSGVRNLTLRQIVPTLCLLRIVEYLGHFVVDEWVSVFYLPILAGSQVYSVDIGKIGTRLHMRLERTLTVYRTHGFAIEYCDYTTRGA
jgi:hypothetical protein